MAAISSVADWQFDQFNAMRRRNPFPENTVHGATLCRKILAALFRMKCRQLIDAMNSAQYIPLYAITSVPTAQTVTESLVFISDDRTHDYNAVHAFVTRAVEHVRCVRHIPFDHIIQGTDGCAAQYRSKGPFVDVSCAAQDYNCTLNKNFFGHGKGSSDGESAVVKSGAARAIRPGTAVIQNAFCANIKLS